jgi:hypothetical protein
MTENYSETLPKTVRLKACYLHAKRCVAYPQAEKIGLIAMMRSNSLLRFTEQTSGLNLEWSSCQVICYEPGDYAGPHNDHHPADDNLREGYVDVHIMFSTAAVDHQWIVWESNGHLMNIRNINLEGGIAVYQLPFWHYTTPLVPKPSREKDARRWLLLTSYNILRD